MIFHRALEERKKLSVVLVPSCNAIHPVRLEKLDARIREMSTTLKGKTSVELLSWKSETRPQYKYDAGICFGGTIFFIQDFLNRLKKESSVSTAAYRAASSFRWGQPIEAALIQYRKDQVEMSSLPSSLFGTIKDGPIFWLLRDELSFNERGLTTRYLDNLPSSALPRFIGDGVIYILFLLPTPPHHCAAYLQFGNTAFFFDTNFGLLKNEMTFEFLMKYYNPQRVSFFSVYQVTNASIP